MRADRCRACQSAQLFTVHDFGAQPLAGYYPLRSQSETPVRRYPLELMQCLSCGLLQIVDLPPIDEVFHDDYRYSSSTVPGLVRHFVEYAGWLDQRLARPARVFEFGCNDGVLLVQLRERGIECVGLDASDNIAALARAKGLAVDTGFLDARYVERTSSAARYDLVTCSNVFAHIHDLQGTIDAVRLLLRPGGLFAIEVHDGQCLESEGQFDTIYHEHLSYFTEQTLQSLLERHGFERVECQRTAMHGGGLRFLARKTEAQRARVPAADDAAPTVTRSDFLSPVIVRCSTQLRQLHAEYGELAGYGAAGRSQMFVNFTGSAGLFSRIYDDSPLRQGRYIAGTDVPIDAYRGESGGCVVILAWNYAQDISQRVRGAFGRIVTLLPELRNW